MRKVAVGSEYVLLHQERCRHGLILPWMPHYTCTGAPAVTQPPLKGGKVKYLLARDT